MRLLIGICFLLMMIGACHFNVFAADNNVYQYGNVLYRVPNGYYQQQSGDTRLIIPNGQSANNPEVAIGIFSGIGSIPGNLKQILSPIVEKVEAGREVIKRQFERFTKEDGTKIVMELSVTKVNGDICYSIYLLANPNGQGELIVLSTSNAAALQKYDQQIKEFFGNVDFVSNNQAGNGHAKQQYSQNNNYRNNQNSNNNSSAIARQRAITNQQNQRAYTNQIFQNSITNNYNSLSRSIY